MNKKVIILTEIMILSSLAVIKSIPVYSRDLKNQEQTDEKAKKFLDIHKYSWNDMNVPVSDGKILYDLIIKNNYKKALEIGTSSGHSGIWIAWVLSKTGGKLITIDIDKSRHSEAVANFEEAGLSGYIDARLGDAHKLVPALEDPFDFVFCDADKYWLTNYIEAVLPKLEKGRCFIAHYVSDLNRTGGIAEFIEYIEKEPSLKTTYDRSSRAGISITR